MQECTYLSRERDREVCGPAVVSSFYDSTGKRVFFCENCWDHSARLTVNRDREYTPLRDNTGLVLEFLVEWARQVRSLA